MGPLFEVWDRILLLGEALEFGGIFQKICIKIIKNMKNFRTCKFFSEKFSVLGAVWGNKNYFIKNRVEWLGKLPDVKKFNNLIKNSIVRLQNLRNFKKSEGFFRKIFTTQRTIKHYTVYWVTGGEAARL